MQNLDEFILEKLNVSKIRKKMPKTKEELVKIMIEEIKENGPDCSLNHIDVSNITDMSYLFEGGSFRVGNDSHPILSEFDGDISEWNVSNVTNMDHMFCRCKYSGKDGDITNWDVSRVTNMAGMFEYCNYNGDISNWDVSNVRAMSYMFEKSKFNGDLSKWDVSNVRRFTHIFMRSSFSGDISNWKINPDAKDHMQRMFTGSPLEKKPPIWYKKR